MSNQQLQQEGIRSSIIDQALLKLGPASKKIRLFAQKLYWREILACLFILIGIYFLRQQRQNLSTTFTYLHQANLYWLIVALFITGVYIFLQSYIYVNSFLAVGVRLRLSKSIELFLKRSLISIFLPGGGITALAYTPGSVRKTVEEKLKIHQASGLFAFAGLFSTFLVGLPVLVMNVHRNSLVGLGIAGASVLLVLLLFKGIRNKGQWYQGLHQRFPKLAGRLYELTSASINKRDFYFAILSSVGVELCGIVHLYISMLAVGGQPSLQAAGVAYILSVLLMVASPFLKGLGAIELSIVYVLSHYGYAPVQALAITIIYRFFEFWLPLFCGIVAFLVRGKEIFLRVFPALLIFALGLINILSVVTPPIMARVHFIRFFVPVAAIHVSNLFVLYVGIMLLVTAAFLIKGRRNAWWIAVIISFLSVPGHLIKALDYEEAFVALLVFTTLVFTKTQYRSKGSPSHVQTGAAVAILGFIAVLVYGFIGFYFLEQRHFGLNFSWQQSIINSIRGFFLLDPENLHPLTRFGREFLRSFHFLGMLAWLFLLYSLIRPYWQTSPKLPLLREKAQNLLHRYGRSSIDYFKLGEDKLLFVSNEREGFVSYRIAGNFAIVLDEPVCAPEDKTVLIQEFDRFCHDKGMTTAFYRVDEDSVPYFTSLKKKKLIIGQEAILDMEGFNLAGRSKKSLRNSLNSLEQKGFTTRVCLAPHRADLMQQLKAVSDEWLYGFKKKEWVFAQGGFNAALLQQQDVVATFDAAGNVVAFLNIIPDFAPSECTYDMIRKIRTAPGGCMDALVIELIHYAQQKQLRFLNLGLVAFSGINQPDNPAEQVMRFAYKKVKRFKHYRGLREFKEKYASAWLNKYLIYENDFDLLQLPRALNKVMQKGNNKLATT